MPGYVTKLSSLVIIPKNPPDCKILNYYLSSGGIYLDVEEHYIDNVIEMYVHIIGDLLILVSL